MISIMICLASEEILYNKTPKNDASPFNFKMADLDGSTIVRYDLFLNQHLTTHNVSQ